MTGQELRSEDGGSETRTRKGTDLTMRGSIEVLNEGEKKVREGLIGLI